MAPYFKQVKTSTMKVDAYLKDGEQVLVHKEIEGEGFIIERYYEYHMWEGDSEFELSGNKELVKTIYKERPTSKKHDDLVSTIEKLEVKNKELKELEIQLRSAQNELAKVQSTKTDLQNLIINRSELKSANTLTIFSGFNAYQLSESDKKYLKIQINTSVMSGQSQYWAYTIWNDDTYGSNKTINPKYGIIPDITEDELIRIGKEIVQDSLPISNRDVLRIDERYLDEKLLEKKSELIADEKRKEIEKAAQKVIEAKEELKKLKSK